MNKFKVKISGILLVLLTQVFVGFAQSGKRQSILLNTQWATVMHESDSSAYKGFEAADYNDGHWKKVAVPHNWDTYHGYRRLLHGNLHGYAWYRKTFVAKGDKNQKRYFLYFEGVGSYATVWLNGKKVGHHAGGRTTFTLEVTDAIQLGKENILAVRADHPAAIRDLPWVCGGCSEERGFSEGSQPLGIFRPVHLIVTDIVRVAPFGVHIWNDTTVSQKSATLQLETEVRNYGNQAQQITIVNRLIDKEGKEKGAVQTSNKLPAGETLKVRQELNDLKAIKLWSPDHPYLYTMITEIQRDGQTVDRIETPYGIRWVSWPTYRKGNDKRFFINGKPFFINGIAEYEHLLGNSHAFDEEQISARVAEMKAAGFNAFRDAHQPHNLRYQQYWDSLGMLSWSQMAAHIWFDNPVFKTNFKQLLTDWIKERRNSPSIILWGLENESTLPEAFAKECTALIRQLDPTASIQRMVTTCNGGTGTDWNVPQNWTGTYGGDPATYAEDLKKQVLVGEYGAWRTLDFHAEAPFSKEETNTEDRMSALMEQKLRLAETARDSAAGQFFWLFNSHDNPGRIQGGEGLRELDRVGPVNYKGLFTIWDEPTDVYYMFRSHLTSATTDPMVYIVSHTWPDRWIQTGQKSGITIYSNCDEVELFNDPIGQHSLGKQKRQGFGIPFTWNDAAIQYNVLYAVGYVKGKKVAKDVVVLRNLPQAPGFDTLYTGHEQVKANPEGKYLYRVNCGGPDYIDHEGHLWQADRARKDEHAWGSSSWTANFEDLPFAFASQRRSFDPIAGTVDWPLLQHFRYGRDQLSYTFPVPKGSYQVELYFVEPWFGTGGGMDASGWRVFDVALNEDTVLHKLDIYQEVGHDAVLKKTVRVEAKNGKIKVHFPRVYAGQAVLSAIAIASTSEITAEKASPPSGLIENLEVQQGNVKIKASTWMDTGDSVYTDRPFTFTQLPADLYGADWIAFPEKVENNANALLRFSVTEDADVFVLLQQQEKPPVWMATFEDTQTTASINTSLEEKWKVYRKRFKKGARVELGLMPEGSAMYTLAVLPVSNLQPAHDLKPSVTYKPKTAEITDGLSRTQFLGKDALQFKSATKAVVTWPISTGVADTYSIMLRYANETGHPIPLKLSLLSEEGLVLHQETLSFVPSRKGKWGYVYTTTGTMINAGKYTLRVEGEGAEGLVISNVEVQ